MGNVLKFKIYMKQMKQVVLLFLEIFLIKYLMKTPKDMKMIPLSLIILEKVFLITIITTLKTRKTTKKITNRIKINKGGVKNVLRREYKIAS